MKANISASIIKSIKERGYVFHGNTWYPPGQVASLRISEVRPKKRSKSIITGWIDDTRNIKNKATRKDPFIRLIEQELNCEVWPEFYFDNVRKYRLDYAIPIMANSTQLKIGIEVQGGVWMKGNSGHSSGTGILRDYEKGNLAKSNGWTIFYITPDQLLTEETLTLIRIALNHKLKC